MIAVVTGASRGAGKGIALALADTGATIYVTGRTASRRRLGASRQPRHDRKADRRTRWRAASRSSAITPTTRRSRHCSRGSRTNSGRLDVLVNNAFAIPDHITSRRPFWEKGLEQQAPLDVGLRSSYVAPYFAAPLLIRGGRLLVNTSSFGGTCYMHGPAYGAVKAGVDKMAHDMAEDFRPFDVAAVSLWMGFLRTERTEALFTSSDHRYAPMTANAESAEFPGRVIAALADESERMTYSGRVLVAAEVARELGVTDVDGRQPSSHRSSLGSPPQYSPAVIH